VIRTSIATMAVMALMLATEGHADSPEIPPAQWKGLVKAVRTIKREYVTAVDDERLARGCAQRVKISSPPVTGLTDVPVVLRAAAAAAPGMTAKELVGQCLTGMLASLDARSVFISAEESREMMAAGTGAAGVELTRQDEAIVVVETIDGGPAATAGIRAGDRVAAIGGRSVEGLTLVEVTRRLRGRVGSTVSVSIARGAEVLELTLTRAVVKPVTVKARVVAPAILHLVVRRFDESTLGETDAALAPLLEKLDTTPRALLLDLRDDTGGLFRGATDFAGALLPPGALVGALAGRRLETPQRITGERAWAREPVAEWLRKVPMAVVVNGGTASGAEIVAAALQAHGRAQVLGTPTAGVGSIQTLVPLDDGSYLRLTTARWLTPKLEALDGRPVTPDVLLVTPQRTGSGARDTMLEQAVDIVKSRRTAPP
jgi:carboxyl-terminal processing protease